MPTTLGHRGVIPKANDGERGRTASMSDTGVRPAPLLAHQPALDGVRGAAVAAVLVFHARPDWLPGGFLGVDVFFVLSGFLITTLLLAEHDRYGRIDLAGFWARRARRLLPALLLVVAFVVVAHRFLGAPEELPALRLDALAALGYAANWRMIYRGGGYFAETGSPSLLQHTWSLAIEEQFYLLWPVLVLLALGYRRPRRMVLLLAGGGAVASAVAAAVCYQPGTDPSRVYYGTDTRAAALVIGCALAAVLANRAPSPRRAYTVLAGGAVVGLAGAAWLADGADGWLYRGGLTLVAVAVAVVLAEVVINPGGLFGTVLGRPWLVALGKVSYGVYLWHWPLFLLLTADRTGQAGMRLFALRIAATLAVAAASYHLVEKPVRRCRPRWRRLGPAFAAAGTVTVAVVLIAGTAPPPAPTTAALAVTAPAGSVAAPSPPSTAPATPAPAAAVPPLRRAGRLPGAAVRVDVFGDSVAFNVGAYLPVPDGFLLRNRAIKGCGIMRSSPVRWSGGEHRNDCPTWDQQWQAAVQGDDPDVAVILLGRWESHDRYVDGRWQHLGEPDFDALSGRELRHALDVVSARGARPMLLTTPYTRKGERPDGGLWPEDDPNRTDAWNWILRDTAAAHPSRPVVVDANRLLCPDARFTWRIDGVRVRTDGLHLTPDAVRRFVAPGLLPLLSSTAAG
jgi:peptidoglycan/LPS O-acetylase OafA/YrhL